MLSETKKLIRIILAALFLPIIIGICLYNPHIVGISLTTTVFIINIAIGLAVIIVVIWLLFRFVKAVEKIANSMDKNDG